MTPPTTPTPGLHYDVPDADYRAWPAISKSDLDKFVKPKKLGRVALIGQALHSLVLEGQIAADAAFHFSDEDYDLRSKEGRKYHADRERELGKTVLRGQESILVRAMRDSLLADDFASRLLQADGSHEVSVVARLEKRVLDSKCRIDMVREHSLWDLKTTHCCDSEEFKNSIADFGYAAQAAYYSDCYGAITGEYKQFYFLCVSKQPPFNVWRTKMPWELVAHGRKWYNDIFTLYERIKMGPTNDTK